MSGELLTVIAYALVWTIVTAYLVLIARRIGRLDREIRDLRSLVSPPSPLSPPPPPSPPSRAATP